jgi:hypothetical protein
MARRKTRGPSHTWILTSAASHLGRVSADTVRRWADGGLVPVLLVSGLRLVDARAIAVVAVVRERLRRKRKPKPKPLEKTRRSR